MEKLLENSSTDHRKIMLMVCIRTELIAFPMA